MEITSSDRSLRNDFQIRLPGGETTKRDLADVLLITQTEYKSPPEFPHGICNVWDLPEQGVDCDEVYPGIYVGDGNTARKKTYLKMLGITHILNAAKGRRYGFVNTDQLYYTGLSIKYLGLPLADTYSTDISKYFFTAAAFIDEAVSTGGKAFVHCAVGVSRSATCVLAYLMIKKGMLARDAIRIVRKNRNIRPNDGFLHQLAQLDNQLRRQRL